MRELGFEGVPVGRAPVEEEMPAGRCGCEEGTAAEPAESCELTARMTQQLQRAHVAVLEAHRAISAWQTRRFLGPARIDASAPAPASLPAPAPPGRAVESTQDRPGGARIGGVMSTLKAEWSAYATAAGRNGRPAAPPAVPAPAPVMSPDEWARHGGPAVILRAAAERLRQDSPGPLDRIELTWHGLPPSGPVTLCPRSSPAGPAGTVRCVVHDETDRPLLTVVGDRDGHRAIEGPDARRWPRELKPLARTDVARLSADDLDALARGQIAAVLGSPFDQQHVAAGLRPEPWPERFLEQVDEIEPDGGRAGQGALSAAVRPARVPDGGPVWPVLWAAVDEALRVYAFHQGVHLCLPGAHAVPLPDSTAHLELLAHPRGRLRVRVEVTGTGWVPRPFFIAAAEVTTQDREVVARLRDVGVALYGRPELEPLLHVEHAGIRLTSGGAPACFTELHMAHAAEGDTGKLAVAGGRRPPSSPVRPRLPRGDFRMVDRGVEVAKGAAPDGTGTHGISEYDVPPDPWYCRDGGTGALSPLALMEMSLQPAGVLGGVFLDMALLHPDEPFVCRNLSGRATLLRDVDPRGTTVTQRVTVLAVTDLPGAALHRYGFELSTGGEAFCSGEALHGYLTNETLQLQQGMDGGQRVPPWLERQPDAPADLRRVDAADDERLGTGRLALLKDLALVPDGGEHGAGYVLCSQPVDADDWFFDQHFPHDPVMPGSVGVQMLFQAVRAFVLYTGPAGRAPGADLGLVAGEELRWNYGGQILREHRQVRGEVHIRQVRRDGDRLLVRADGSVWRDDLRIYHVRNIVLGTR
ncbi:3-hydroxyacyl-ACP dehydratase [Streptomyces sp. NPDC049585]|uniref:3-hydroxyacyl-ACP dehydratase n=1 Tax=Streptomyces sp. NPDC049585 TaxID=3155154 RepID=UPI00342B0E9C